MIGRIFFAGIAALLLGACEEPDPPPPEMGDPFLWEIANADGQVEGWLYGTIHALPSGVLWNDGTVSDIAARADYLVVEVANLGDEQALATDFIEAARSAGHPPLHQRVPVGQRALVEDLVGKTAYSVDDFRDIETWAAALILAQVLPTDAESRNGVDKALMRQFSGRRIMELEGAEEQFAIFDALAEEDQRALLQAVVDQAKDPARASLPTDLWIGGDEDALTAELDKGMLADPELREALLVKRNRDWTVQLVRELAGAPRPLIAVGTAHLLGKEGVPALLRQRGYKVRRLR